MTGHGEVRINGVGVYAAWEGEPRRLRVSADDWERLGLHRGQRVELALPGEPPVGVFVAADTFTPPGWVWLTLVRQRAAACRAAG